MSDPRNCDWATPASDARDPNRKRARALLIDFHWVRDYDLSLALGYLKAFADADPAVRASWDVEILHFPVETPPETVVKAIRDREAALVGFSCYMWSMPAVEATLASFDPDERPIFVLGGVEVSPRPVRALERNRNADAVVVGEGEETFRDLLRALGPGRTRLSEDTVGAVQGLVWRGDRAIRTNAPRPPMRDLSSIPSPYLAGAYGVSLEGRPLAMIETTRGCPFRCSFCFESRGFKQVRSFPLDRVKREVAFLVGRGIREIVFLDTNFNLNAKRSLEILRHLKALGGKVRYVFEVWGERLDEEQVRAMAGVECAVEMGLQTTNPVALEAMGRPFDPVRFETGVKRLLDAGPYRPCAYSREAGVMIDVIAGLPFDRMEDILASVDYSFSLYPSKIGLSVMKVLPGTQVYEDRRRYGYQFDPDRQYIMISSKFLRREEVGALIGLNYAVEFAYNRNHAARTLAWLAGRLGTSPSRILLDVGRHLEGHPRHWKACTANDLAEILAEICRERGREKLARKVSRVLTAEMVLNVLQKWNETRRTLLSRAFLRAGHGFLRLLCGLPAIPCAKRAPRETRFLTARPAHASARVALLRRATSSLASILF